MEIDDWLSGVSGRMADLQQRSAELTENIGAASARASSPDGAVTVEIGANGGLHSIEFGKDIEGRTPTQLSELVMKTVHSAQRKASEKVSEVLGEFGEDGEMLERYVSYQPPLDAEELAELENDPAEFGVAQEEAAPPPPPAQQPPRMPTPAPAAGRRHAAREEEMEEEENNPW